MASYTYPRKEIRPSILHKQVSAQLTGLVGIVDPDPLLPTNIAIVFNRDLTAAEQTTLTGIYNGHTIKTYSWTGPDAPGSAKVISTGEVDMVTAGRIRNVIAKDASFEEQVQEQLKLIRLAIAAQDVMISREYRTDAEVAQARGLLDRLRAYHDIVEDIRTQGKNFKAANADLYNDSSQAMAVTPVAGSPYVLESVEDLTAQIDGIKTLFTLAPYVPGTLRLYYGGLFLTKGDDFTESDPAGGKFTMSYAPKVGQKLLVERIKK